MASQYREFLDKEVNPKIRRAKLRYNALEERIQRSEEAMKKSINDIDKINYLNNLNEASLWLMSLMDINNELIKLLVTAENMARSDTELTNSQSEINRLSDRINQINDTTDYLNGRQRYVKELIDKIKQPKEEKKEAEKSGRVENETNFIDKLCQDYNEVVDNPQKRIEFMQKYQPIRITVENFHEIHKNAVNPSPDRNLKPIFKTSNDGDYYVIKIDGRIEYAIVPRFSLTFIKYSYFAMRDVFDCPNYNPRLRYRNVKIVKPAFFEPDSAKVYWNFKKKGELNLGIGETI